MTVLRWVLVLPAALAGGLAVRFVALASSRLGLYCYMGGDAEHWLVKMIQVGWEGYMGTALLCGGFVYIGTRAAPGHWRAVAWALSAAAAVAVVVGVAVTVYVGQYWLLAECLGGATGVVFGAVSAIQHSYPAIERL